MKAKYKFVLGRRASAVDTLELEVYAGRDCRVYINTRFKIPAKYWDAQRQVVSGRMPNAIEINLALQHFREKIEKAELRAISANKPFGKEEIKAAANDRKISTEIVTEIFSKYNDDDYNSEVIRFATYNTAKAMIVNFKDFLANIGLERMSISQLDLEIIKKFEAFLINNCCKPTTVNTYVNIVRKLYNRALKNNLIEGDDIFKQHKKRKTDPVNKRGLTSDELSKIEALLENTDLPKTIERTIDKFLFSCYTGLRISDNNSLLKTELHTREEGLLLIKKTQKTGIIVTIPLWNIFAGKAQTIAKKYIEKWPTSPYLFPKVININNELNTIKMLANIDTQLTFHIARHTCASMLAEITGNPILIKSILGHASITMSMTYIHQSQNAIIDNLDKYRW